MIGSRGLNEIPQLIQFRIVPRTAARSIDQDQVDIVQFIDGGSQLIRV